MKRSIRLKFTALFIGLLAAVLLAIWAVNSFFLEQYYIKEKVKILQNAYEQLNQYAVEQAAKGGCVTDQLQSFYSTDGEQTEVSRMLRVMNEQYNTTVVVIDSLNDRTFPAFWDGRLLADLVHQYILGKKAPDTETIISEENYKIEKSYDKHSKSYYLQNWGFLEDNRTIFIMSMPIASIHESVALSNRFMVYVGMAALVIGAVLMYFAGKKITSPILSLAALSERMSELDFDARYTADSQDEIGVLGHSMNTLSEKLKDTIGALKTANNELQQDIEEKIRRVLAECDKVGRQDVGIIPGPHRLALFLYLHFSDVGDFALDGLNGLELIHRLNMERNRHFRIHLQNLRKELVGELGR